MKITEQFKKAINDVFYDKQISFYLPREVEEDLGSIKSEPGQFIELVYGNYVETSDERILNTFGATEKGDAVITCESSLARKGDYAIYGDRTSRVVSIKRYDSHMSLLVEYV